MPGVGSAWSVFGDNHSEGSDVRRTLHSWSAASLPSSVRVVRVWGVRVIGLLAVLNLLLGVLQYVGAIDTSVEGSWYSLIDINEEQNVPTWFSTLLLAGASLAAAGVAQLQRRRGARTYRWWGALAALYGFASLDEMASLHERLIVPVREAFDLSGALYSAWVVPGLIVIAVLTGVFWRFSRSLPGHLKWRFGLGAVLFFGGAVGFEMVGAAAFSRLGAGPLSGAMAVAEETLEMLGALLWLETMLVGLDLELKPVPVAARGTGARALASGSGR